MTVAELRELRIARKRMIQAGLSLKQVERVASVGKPLVTLENAVNYVSELLRSQEQDERAPVEMFKAVVGGDEL